MSDTRWAIRLRSKHTGAEIPLGMTYATKAEAEEAAAEECHRCNSVSVVPAYATPTGVNQAYVDWRKDR